MKNNKFDIINYDIPKFDVKVEFTYHRYDEDTEDNNPINDADLSLKKDDINLFLSNKIIIELKDLKDRLRFDSNISFLSNIDPDVLVNIQSFQNQNLNNFLIDDKKGIEYFNSNLRFDDKSISFISGLNVKYKKRILEAYGLDKNLYLNLTKYNQRNVIYGTDYLHDIMQNKLNSQYAYDFKNSEFLSDINQVENEIVSIDYLSKNISVTNDKLAKLFENQRSDKQVINTTDTLPLLFNFIPFDIRPVIEDDALLKNETGVAFVGFLIKKHIKNANGDTILDAASQFIYINIKDTPADQIILYDGLLNYANSYSYEIIPTFYLGLYRYLGYENFNFPLISHHLVWNNSQRTEFVRAVDYYAPEPPNGVIAKFLSQKFQADIMWSHPTNPQNDVIGFQIYRRKSLEEPFKLIKVYLKKKISEFKHMKMFSDILPEDEESIKKLIKISDDNTLKDMYHFIDESVDLTKETYIYAICSIDAHGYISNYSSQIGLRYSKIYNSLIVDQVSMQNAPRSYPNLYVQRKSQLFQNEDLIFDFTPNFKNKDKITIYFTPDALNVENNQIFNINNQYQLSVSRLNDLDTKNIKFKLNLP